MSKSYLFLSEDIENIKNYISKNTKNNKETDVKIKDYLKERKISDVENNIFDIFDSQKITSIKIKDKIDRDKNEISNEKSYLMTFQIDKNIVNFIYNSKDINVFTLKPKNKIEIEDLLIEKKSNISSLKLELYNLSIKKIDFINIDKDDIKFFILSLKDIIINKIGYKGTDKDKNSELGKWIYLLENIKNIYIEGSNTFHEDKEIDYKITELLYRKFKEENKMLLLDQIYQNLLEKYKKLPTTSTSDKIILFLNDFISKNRTDIKRPLFLLGLIWCILFCLSYILKTNLIFLMTPLMILNLKITSFLIINEYITYTIAILINAFVLVLYYQIIVMLRKFAQNKLFH